jgi:AcrR family transcriptional regulator
MKRNDKSGGRRAPSQERSRQLVAAVREAGRLLLAEEGSQALTTTRIAERAGVSIGSLYQYFADKAAILAAIYEEERQHELENAAPWVEQLRRMGPRERLRVGIAYAAERHRKMLGLDPDFYRERHQQFRIGDDLPGAASDAGELAAVALARQLIAAQPEDLKPVHEGHAAFLLGRGVAAILRAALEDQPELLSDPSFLDELVEMMTAYLFGDAARRRT